MQQCWPRAPDFGSVSIILLLILILSAIISFLLQDIPRHPDTRLFPGSGGIKTQIVTWFSVVAYISHFFRLRRPSRGAIPPKGSSGGLARRRRARDAEPLINALVPTPIIINSKHTSNICRDTYYCVLSTISPQ